MFALENADFYTGQKIVSDKSLLIKDGKVFGFVNARDVPLAYKKINLNGLNVSAGFVDSQVNGGGGVLFNDEPTIEGIRLISAAHRRYGTTAFLPTLITSTKDRIKKAIRATEAAMQDTSIGVLGLHLEGPFIEHSKAGVHDKDHIRDASLLELEQIFNYEGAVVAMITVAPEKISPLLISFLKSKGAKIMIGHSNATCEQVTSLKSSGIVGVTHLYNAMSQLGSREPGIVGFAMSESDIYSSIIADGHHVAWPSVIAAKNAIGKRLFLVTDAMPPVGDSSENFVLGPYSITRIHDKLLTSDGVLAGSCLDMASAVRNCVQKAGIPLNEALNMASLYPAKLLGVEDKIGSIAEGKAADLVVFNNQVIVKGTVKNGVPCLGLIGH